MPLDSPTHIDSSSNSNISRQSSARSTSSVQAVPIKTPNRNRRSPLWRSEEVTRPSSYEFPASIENLKICSDEQDRNENEELERRIGRSPRISETETETKRVIETRRSNSRVRSIQDFQLGEILGEGSYSTVFHARPKGDRHHESYAVKVLDKRHIQKEKKVKYVQIERDTLNLLDHHPGCIRLFATFQDDFSLYYLLEYAANGEILKYIKQLGSLSVKCVKFYGAQVLDAIHHMHSRGVIHRDLKPENILLDHQMRIKIADFGSAKILTKNTDETADDRSHSFVGTAEYVSPELLLNKITCPSSDIWAFGCILYQLLAGVPPFKSRSEYLTFQKIIQLDYQFPDGFPSTAQRLIERLLVPDPSQRLGAGDAGIGEIKADEFFEGSDWEHLWTVDVPCLEPGMIARSDERPRSGVEDELDVRRAELEFATPEDSKVGRAQLDIVPGPAESDVGPTESEIGPTESDAEVVKPASITDDAPERPVVDGSNPVSIRKDKPELEMMENSTIDHTSSKKPECTKKKSWFKPPTLGSGKLRVPSGGSRSELGSTWPEIYLPNELIIYSSAVYEIRSSNENRKPNSLSLFKKSYQRSSKRELILTNHSRLLSIKEEKSSYVRVKDEILFKALPTDHGRTGEFWFFKSVEVLDRKVFLVHTSVSKVFRFEDPNECAERWRDELNLAYQNSQQQQVFVA